MNMIIDEANREKHDNIDLTMIAAFTSGSFVIMISTFVGSQLDDIHPMETFLFPMSFRIGEIGDKSSNEEAMLICIHLKVAYHGTAWKKERQ